MPIDRDPNHLYPAFREKIEMILSEVEAYCVKHCPEYKPGIVEGFRTTKRQKELYAQGRTTKGKIVTNKNGTTNPSNHQSALAVDVAFKRSGAFRWDVPNDLWEYLGHCARAQGLTWGGDWKTLVDRPHIEWPTADNATYTKAKDWKKSTGLT